MLLYHLNELRYRIIYCFCSCIVSLIISLSYLPELLQKSPFVFLNNRWDETLFTLIEIATFISIVVTLPLILWHIYLYMKPALFAKELIEFKLILSWSAFVAINCLIFIPLLVFKLPYFLLTFQSDTMMFYPTFSALSGIIIELLLAFMVLWAVPILIKLNWQRGILYSIIILFSAIFIDVLTIILVFIPLILVTEFSFIVIIFVKKLHNYI